MAVKGAKALEVWAKRVTDGYPNVKIRDMSSSWKNGLAFCAIVHRFRPDLIDFDKLDPDQIERNCSLVFRVAEDKLGIPSLLDPSDMAECGSPDRLSILTYLSEFYHKFKSEKSPSCSPVTNKKDEKICSKPLSPLTSSSSPPSSSLLSPSSSSMTVSNKSGPDLKRKDSCDSGVSVSPLGSVCNSPPGIRRSASALTSDPTRSVKRRENTENNMSSSDSPSTPSFLLTPSTPSLRSDSLTSSSLSTPVTKTFLHDRSSESPGSGLENLLKQRLKISLETSKEPAKVCLDASQNSRTNMLQSMISVSNSETKMGGSRNLSEPTLNNNVSLAFDSAKSDDSTQSKCNSSISASIGTQRSDNSRVSTLSKSFADSLPSNKFVSKTTISMSPNNPIKYAANNSVSCDIKTNSNLNNSPKSWKEFCSGSLQNASPSTSFSSNVPLSSTPKKSVSASHLVQVRVNEREGSLGSTPTNNLVINPSKISTSAPRFRPGENNLNCNTKNSADNSFKSRMMRFEQLINPSKFSDEISAERSGCEPVSDTGVKLSCSLRSQEDGEGRDRQCPEVSKNDRRKTISFPASFALSSISDNTDSRLTF